MNIIMSGIENYGICTFYIIIGYGIAGTRINGTGVDSTGIILRSLVTPDSLPSLVHTISYEVPYITHVVISESSLKIRIILPVVGNVKIRTCLSSFLDAVIHKVGKQCLVIISSEDCDKVGIACKIIIEIIYAFIINTFIYGLKAAHEVKSEGFPALLHPRIKIMIEISFPVVPESSPKIRISVPVE